MARNTCSPPVHQRGRYGMGSLGNGRSLGPPRIPTINQWIFTKTNVLSDEELIAPPAQVFAVATVTHTSSRETSSWSQHPVLSPAVSSSANLALNWALPSWKRVKGYQIIHRGGSSFYRPPDLSSLFVKARNDSCCCIVAQFPRSTRNSSHHPPAEKPKKKESNHPTIASNPINVASCMGSIIKAP
jgi:hypothetical protein